jgi:hypothetical protein
MDKMNDRTRIDYSTSWTEKLMIMIRITDRNT